MKLKQYFAILFLSSIFSFAQSKDSFVVIKGTTNVNTFKCINNDFHQPIPVSVETSQKNKFSETTISLAVKDFDCKNNLVCNLSKCQKALILVSGSLADNEKACSSLKIYNDDNQMQVDSDHNDEIINKKEISKILRTVILKTIKDGKQYRNLFK